MEREGMEEMEGEWMEGKGEKEVPQLWGRKSHICSGMHNLFMGVGC